MAQITALEAKTRFGELLDMAQRAPVTVTKNGRPSVVVMSYADFERRNQSARVDLIQAMDRIAAEAKANGLSEEELDRLLAEES